MNDDNLTDTDKITSSAIWQMRLYVAGQTNL